MGEFFSAPPQGPGSGDDWFQQFLDGKDWGAMAAYNHLYQNLVYYAYKIVKDEEVARDIVNECIMRAWMRRSKFQSPKHLQNWLFETVHNECISWLRRKGKEAAFLESLAQVGGSEEAEGGAFKIELTRIRVMERVMTELDLLRSKKFKMYTVLKMTYFDQKKDEEIAEFLKIKKGNVYTIRHRGLRFLKRRLGGDWPLALSFFFLKDVL